jgi:hypothetical protein
LNVQQIKPDANTMVRPHPARAPCEIHLEVAFGTETHS